jgi:hypothetical protein
MRMHFFDVTIKVEHQGRPIETVLYKGARAGDELTARRIILNRYLESGFRVVRLERVDERAPEATPGL